MYIYIYEYTYISVRMVCVYIFKSFIRSRGMCIDLQMAQPD